MTPPKRIQLSRAKGWRKPVGAIVVSRPGKWGNPFTVGDRVVVTASYGENRGLPHEMEGRLGATVEQAVDGFRDLMALRLGLPPYGWEDSDYHEPWIADLGLLRGRDLACWCPLDQPCHADVLLELANR